MNNSQTHSSLPEKQINNNLSINEYKDITNHANQEIAHVRSVYKWLGSLLTILLILGTYFTFKSASEMRQEIRDDMATLNADMRRLKEEVKTKVKNELEKDSIQDLITTEVSYHINENANKIIDEQITNKIKPKINEVESKLAEVNSKLKESDKILKTIEPKSMRLNQN